MKKIISCLLVIILITACKKTEIPLQTDQNYNTEPSTAKGGGTGPTVTTNSAAFLTSVSATSGGSVSSGGGGSTTTERGVCYNTSPNPSIANFKTPSGSGAGSFTSILSDLNGSTTYYVRAYATKSTGTTYGNQVSFTTLPDHGTVTDMDGNVYRTINIGGQVWMAENLKTTKYSNGVPIPNVTDDATWGSLTTSAYCNYNNDESFVSTYGRLYNWYAAIDTNNLAPAGFHVPSDAEWVQLANYLGGINAAGGRVKELGLAHWNDPNNGADNSSGLTGLPGGGRFVNWSAPIIPVVFNELGGTANWWTTTDNSDPLKAKVRTIESSSTSLYRIAFIGGVGYTNKRTGYSIRCVKN